MPSSNTVRLELTDRQLQNVRDALAEEMARTCEIIREHFHEHLDGSPVALADARDWLATLNGLAEAMEQLDPPGWQETLGKLKAV